MRPNGRRRWRKWAKRWRRGQTLARADAILRRAKSIPLPGLSGAVAKKAKRSLRPCLGCLECEPKDCDGCGFSLGSGEDCKVCDAHTVDRYVMGCNGSGILPARRQP